MVTCTFNNDGGLAPSLTCATLTVPADVPFAGGRVRPGSLEKFEGSPAAPEAQQNSSSSRRSSRRSSTSNTRSRGGRSSGGGGGEGGCGDGTARDKRTSKVWSMSTRRECRWRRYIWVVEPLEGVEQAGEPADGGGDEGEPGMVPIVAIGCPLYAAKRGESDV